MSQETVAKPSSDEITEPVEALQAILSAYVLSMSRLTSAQVVSLTTKLVLLEANANPKLRSEDLARLKSEFATTHDIVNHLQGVRYEDFDSFKYVDDVMRFVYATTLFDTLLQGITRFLFFLHPAAACENLTVPLANVLNAKNRVEVLETAINERVRNAGRDSFLERISFLNKKFKLQLSIDEKTRSSLEHYASVRNTAVHDQGFLAFELQANGGMKLVRERCPLHPTPIADSDYSSARAAQGRVIKAIAGAIVRRVLKAENEDGGRKALSMADAIEQMSNRRHKEDSASAQNRSARNSKTLAAGK